MLVFKGSIKLFVLAYAYGNNITNENTYKNIFFQELKQKITTSKLMEETFMIRQLMTVCLLDFACFEKNYGLIAVDFSKQKALDTKLQILKQFNKLFLLEKTYNQIRVFDVLEKSKEKKLEFATGTSKVL